jgi:ADP-ribose pyrophosphatase YjhB (NUDIX family)
MDKRYRNPFPTVDIIIEIEGSGAAAPERSGIVLISRKNPPLGWALPGGFVDYGETLEDAARREAFEETSLKVDLVRQFHAYSDPQRDPRHHTITMVFIARARGLPRAADDARDAIIVGPDELPDAIVFDHGSILDDYFSGRY